MTQGSRLKGRDTIGRQSCHADDKDLEWFYELISQVMQPIPEVAERELQRQRKRVKSVAETEKGVKSVAVTERL